MTTATPANKKVSTGPVRKMASKAVKPVAKKAPSTQVTAPVPSPLKAAKSVTVKTDKKKDKPEKVKVVRDSFTIPKTEYAQIAAMKKRAMDLGLEAKKSELIRAGLAMLASTSDAAFRKVLGTVPTLKTGRPGKS